MTEKRLTIGDMAKTRKFVPVLLPCPECGEVPYFEDYEDLEDFWLMCSCEKFPAIRGDTKEKCIIRWNGAVKAEREWRMKNAI